MIAEDVLERALGVAAEGYDVPDGAVERLREQLAPSVAAEDEDLGRLRRLRLWRPTGQQWLIAGAASFVVLIGLALALGGGGGDSGGGAATTAAPAHGSASVAGVPPRVGGAPGGSAGTGGSAGLLYGPITGTAQVPAPRAPVLAAPGTKADAAGVPRSALTTQSGSSVARPLPAPGDSARVVKTGELDLRVKKGEVTNTLDRLTGLATVERGYISDSSTSEGGDNPSGQVTMRVPVESFEPTVARARSYGKVLSLQTSGNDVTAQYSDIQARIKALKATRSTFLTILSRATTIGDTLAVQQRITDVQTEIDQLQGRLNVLADQSDLATLTVTVDQVAKPLAVGPKHHQSGLAKAVDRSVGRFVRGVEAIIGVIGPILLVLMVVALGWLAARFGYRVLRRRLV